MVWGSIASARLGCGKVSGGRTSGFSRDRERVAGLGHGQLRDRADLARLELADRLLVLAVEEQQLADPLVLAARRVPDVALAVDGPGEDAEIRQPPDVRVRGGLEDADEERPGRVRADLDLRAGLRVAGRDRRLLAGGRQVADERVEQAPHADALGRAADEHGREDGFADALVEAGVQLGVGDLLALEVLRQDVVVRLGRGLQQLVAATGDLVGHRGGDLRLDLLVALPAVHALRWTRST